MADPCKPNVVNVYRLLVEAQRESADSFAKQALAVTEELAAERDTYREALEAIAGWDFTSDDGRAAGRTATGALVRWA